MSASPNSIDPFVSASVSASAGTGKTWMLVSRLIRLLLNDARAEGILALTFTRKAAGEMQMRLYSRLLELAQCSPPQLDQYLQEIGASLDDATRNKARGLYETLLSSAAGVKTTTFHAFCQDILRRFPLEAGIPPGFELQESTAELQQAAWDALCTEASQQPDGVQAKALESLFSSCGSLDNTRKALNDFLDHRSDWWAYTEQQTQALDFAIENLGRQLAVSTEDNPQADFFTAGMTEMLAEFSGLLRKHPNKKNDGFLARLSVARDTDRDFETRFTATCAAFLTQKGEPLARKESKAQAKSMGEDGQQRFLQIHHGLCQAIAETRNKLAAQLSLQRSSDWYQAGHTLLQHFQRLKAEQRVLDFADLEWQAYRLLNHGNNVHWIQYKLDQRIDHLLIDEFQDTNPTQWRLILPLLQELAAGENERGRTVFLVGDNKQSIYRFRRADPELFDTAQHWLHDHLHAVQQPLDTSWRSAPAIIDFVNHLFSQPQLRQQLKQFHSHQTHHQQLWGQVELLPLVESASNTETPPRETLRNPLTEPRILQMDTRYLQEGRQIADRIQILINEQTPIGPADNARPIRYQDIMLLVRKRTHIADYEQALREAGIPYASANRGTLLESQEAEDLLRLLEFLVAPFNNLALASLLRSPIFACSEDDLIALAKIPDGPWIERLAILSATTARASLQRAHQLLCQWRALVDRRPVHDLLDHIFCQADIMRRYQAAYPAHLQHRVTANLTRFLELALEVDSGRYPTIGHFVARLQTLRQQQQEAPDEGVPAQGGSRVRIMTIHAAKGLESPVVFLADCSNSNQGKDAFRALVEWPAQSAQPDYFLLAGKKDELDNVSKDILQRQKNSEAREDANLLYVAVTRARQLLFLSGCRPTRDTDLAWYGMAQAGLRAAAGEQSEALCLSSGSRPAKLNLAAANTQAQAPIDTRLHQVLEMESVSGLISPSHTADYPQLELASRQTGEDQQTRGIAIHRMLELLCVGESRKTILARVSSECGLAQNSSELPAWYTEAESTFMDPALAGIFKPEHYQQAHNELAIHYQQADDCVYGIIDRVVIKHGEILVIDYKTHAIARKAEAIPLLLQHYRQQIALYCQGVKQLWPDKAVHGCILFTATRSLQKLDIKL